MVIPARPIIKPTFSFGIFNAIVATGMSYPPSPPIPIPIPIRGGGADPGPTSPAACLSRIIASISAFACATP